ncbi:MAG: HDOD domain-containing protein [Gammaproteobacteria bacterium]|nr:HDOD domain-containing protein [Gammaproteobacteria bacterium]MDH5652473.1 HDOD domain-containing protein [Gammaproteobacteria bacterium]
MSHTYVGSQPIYSRDLAIYAFQLLFRNSTENRAGYTNGDRATSDVIINTLTDIGLDRLVGSHRACINFTRNFIVGEYPIPNLTQRIIIELQGDDIADDPLIINALHQLSRRGFILALSEKMYQQHFAGNRDFNYIVRFNPYKYTFSELKNQNTLIKQDKQNVHTLVEKIETNEMFSQCVELGFDYYQGFFFCEPNIVKGRGIPANKLQLLRILGTLQDENIDNKTLEEMIGTDVGLTFRLLRYANSSHLGLNTRVDSIQHAVSLLGWNTVKMITTLLVLSSVDDKPAEVLFFGLLRARMCETLAAYVPVVDKNAAFTAGLLSILDIMLDAPMEDVLAEIPLSDALISALLNRRGKLGGLLDDAVYYIEHKPHLAANCGLKADLLAEHYLNALSWANTILPALRD